MWNLSPHHNVLASDEDIEQYLQIKGIVSSENIQATLLPRQDVTPIPQRFTFHPSVRLPIELRSMIWTLIIPGERIIPLRYHRDTLCYTSQIYPPAILQINAESRAFALRIYKEITMGLGTVRNTVRGAYMDLSGDSLYICSDIGFLRKQQMRRTDPEEFDKYLWMEHLQFICDDLLGHFGTEFPTKKVGFCEDISTELLLHVIRKRGEFSLPITEWLVISKGDGVGALDNMNLKEDPMMLECIDKSQWNIQNDQWLRARFLKLDTSEGRAVTLDFKMTHWHWSR